MNRPLINVFALMVIFSVLGSVSTTNAANGLPEGFYFETIASGLGKPTAMAFAPDGRIFLLLKKTESSKL